MKAKLLRRMMMILTLLGLLTVGAWAANTVSSGTCGEYVNWTLNSDGVLTISGEGAMKSYLSYADVPWYNERNSIKTVVIKSGVTSIGKSAFYHCESMTDITIPDTVTKIGWESFENCRSLTSIDIPDSVTEIIGCAFHSCSSLTSVTIPSGVTSLGEGTFAYCTSLVSVTFPEGMTSIGDTTFCGCTSLTSIDIPDSVTAIEDLTFAKCTALTSITIPDGVTSIGYEAFDGCTSLREISIPSGVTSIGKQAFRNCSGLSAVTFTGNAPTIASDAFENDNAAAYYSRTDATWTASMRQNYGGTLAWSASCLGNHTPVTDAAVAPTCTQPGKTEGSHCIYCNEVLVAQKEIPAKGHTPKTVAGKDATCTESGLTEGSKCAVCGTVLTQQKEIPAKGHTPEAVAGKEANCTESGLTEGSKCAVCGTVLTEQKEIPAKGHQWNEDWISDEEGHWHACTVCGAKKDENAHVSAGAATEDTAETCAVCGYTMAPPLGHIHTNHLTFVEAKAAACTEPGSKAYYVCSCGMWFADEAAQTEITDHSDVVLLPLGHTPEAVAGKDATCTESGLTEGSKCAVCGTVLTEQKEIPAKGHTPETVAGKDATCTESGLTEGSKCAVCGTVLTEQKTIAALGHSFTKYTYNNDAKAGVDGTETAKCDRCGAADTRTAVGTALPKIPFTDIAPGAYYEKAVAWAVDSGITNGTSDTTFSPDAPCNRGQIVTFLWRMAGKPIAQNRNNPFTDVKEGTFCYEAVLWAAEQGITTGKTATTFCPAETCNRGQIVTFLWRYAGKPAPQNPAKRFNDVAAGSFCDQAVLWAVENRITFGKTATTFDPTGKCTRAQAVTFLYRGRELLKDRVFD